MTLNEIIEKYPEEEFLKVDGFDNAVIGVQPISLRLIYDKELMVMSLLETEDMELIDALEYLDFNVFSAYVGEKTPIYIDTNTII
jgi:hypothetical protein